MDDSPQPLRVLGLHHIAWPVSAVHIDDVLRLYATRGFSPIPRPDLGFPGAWIQKDKIVVHLLEGDLGSRFALGPPGARIAITYSMHDVPTSLEFFSRILGLDAQEVHSAKVPVAKIVLPTCDIFLMGEVPKKLVRSPNSRASHVAFGVTDIDAAERWLKYCGVTYIRKTQRGSGIEQIFLVDPDDHTIELNPSPMP